MASYFILTPELNPNYCAIYEMPDALQNYENNYYPADGIRAGNSFPKGMEFSMTADVPGIKIADVIDNALNYLMVSAHMQELLKQHATAEIEFLRFTLLNHKGRKATDECYIANIIGAVDCVDKKRTEGRDDPVNQGRYMVIKRLYLLEEQIDPKLNLFRLSSRPSVVIVREDLKRILEEARMAGALYHALGTKVRV